MQPIEDMVEGVIYRDKWRAACMIQYCDICGKKRLVSVRHGKPVNTRCHPCSNQTPEKRAIMSKCHKGKCLSSDTKRKLSESLKRRYCIGTIFREKLSKAGFGRIVSEETRKKISIANKGQYVSEEKRANHSKRMKELWSNKEWVKHQRKLMEEGLRNYQGEEGRRRKIGKSSKERWANFEYRDKTLRTIFKAYALRPTKPEKELDKLLQANFPKQWKYNGDFSHNMVINGLVPDFVNINGKKQVIEVFGDYWHNPKLRYNISLVSTEHGRMERFKEFGFGCLIIWEHEMKKPLNVLAKIKGFSQRL